MRYQKLLFLFLKRAVLFGQAILATTLLLEVAYPQETKGVELRLISKQPIEAPKKRGKVEEIKSENGKFKGIIVYGPGTEFLPIEKFTLLDSKGNIIWEKDHPGATGIDITNDGSVIAEALRGARGPTILSFYDPKGNLIKRTDELRIRGPSFTLNDVRLITVNTGRDGLLVFDFKGNLVKNYGPCRDYIVSSDFKSLVINTFEKELHFYRNGNLVSSQSVEYSPVTFGMVISPDGEYFALLSSKMLYFFEIDKAKLLWQITSKECFPFRTVDLSRGAERIVVGVDSSAQKREEHTNGYVYILNKKGEKLLEQRVEYSAWNIWTPRVDISDDGELLSVKTSGEIYKFKLK